MKASGRIHKDAEREGLPLGTIMCGDSLAHSRIVTLGMTQATLAKHLGVAPHSISDWERGVRPMPRAHSLAVRWLVRLALTG